MGWKYIRKSSGRIKRMHTGVPTKAIFTIKICGIDNIADRTIAIRHHDRGMVGLVYRLLELNSFDFAAVGHDIWFLRIF